MVVRKNGKRAESSSSEDEEESYSSSSEEEQQQRGRGRGRAKAGAKKSGAAAKRAGGKRKAAETPASDDSDADAEGGGDNDSSSAAGAKGKKRPAKKSRRAEVLEKLESDANHRAHVVAACVRHIFYADSTKRPAKRQEFTAGPLIEFKGVGGVLDSVLPDVQGKFRDIFGIDLYESEAGFMLRSNLPPELRKIAKPASWDPSDINSAGSSAHLQEMHLSLLMTVLALIFLHQTDSIPEDTLKSDLKQLGFETEVPHADFQAPVGSSDVKNKAGWERVLERTLVDQKWLRRFPPESRAGAEAQWHYAWGERAKKETSNVEVVKFISMITGEEPDRQWLLDAEQADREMLGIAEEEKEPEEPKSPNKRQVRGKPQDDSDDDGLASQSLRR